MAETASQEDASVSNGERCPVAKVDLVANSTHLITVDPRQVTREGRPPVRDIVRGYFYGNSRHHFSVQVDKTDHPFCFYVNTHALFSQEDYDRHASHDKVAICMLSSSHSLTFASANISIYREGQMMASLKGKKVPKNWLSTNQVRDKSKKLCNPYLFYDALQSAFRPVPDQALTLKVELWDLGIPTKVAADGNRIEMCKLVTYEKTKSQFAADMAKYMDESDTDKHFDLKLICQGETIKSHKLILSARSRVFRMILSNNSKEAQTGVIEIEDSDPSTLKEFVKFMYSEELNQIDCINSLEALLHLADKYDVDTLTKTCSQRLLSKMNMDNACDILRLARKYRLDLEEIAKEYVAEQAKDIIKTDSWNELLHYDPSIANEIMMKILK